MSDRAFMVTPCDNCPYRIDAPRQHWHRKEFERVLETDADPMGTTFACHKQGELDAKDRGWCAGWALDQKKRGVPSIAFRLLLYKDPDAMTAFEKLNDGGHPLFKTVVQMCAANGVHRRRSVASKDHPSRIRRPKR